MKFTFSKNGTETNTIIEKLKDFFITHADKKIKFIDQDNYESDPLSYIKISSEPIQKRIGHTITDIYDQIASLRVVNTILQLYLGKHLPVGDKDAIWMGEGSTIEFFDKGFIITQQQDGDTSIRQLTVKVLGFENVSFDD